MSDINISPELAKTIAKVKHLLALTKNNTEENEVKAAAAAADRLMQEHRISQAMLELQGEVKAEPMVRVVVSQGGRRTAWREVLLHALTLHYGCAWYLSSYRYGGEAGTRGRKGSKGTQAYTVVGREGDVAIVEYMFSHLEGECERLCRWNAGGRGVKYALAWIMGCSQGISAQFSDMRAAARAQAAQGGQSAALVLLDKRESEAKTHMKEKYGVGEKLAAAIHGAQDYEARNEGYNVGKTVQIRQGIGEGTPIRKLA